MTKARRIDTTNPHPDARIVALSQKILARYDEWIALRAKLAKARERAAPVLAST
jgi:hypothetical protein